MQAHTGSRNLIGSVDLTGANEFCSPKVSLIAHIVQAFRQVVLIIFPVLICPEYEPVIGRIASKVPIIMLNQVQRASLVHCSTDLYVDGIG